MRPALLVVGLLVLAFVWFGPLEFLAGGRFAAHMIMHMGVVAVAAPLLALGVAGSRFDPARRWPRLLAPVPLSVLELIIVWAWHAPGPHHLARHTAGGFVAEQGMFLTAGVLLWLSALGGPRPRSGARAGAGVLGLLLTSMHMTLLGALLALSPRPLYAHHHVMGGLSPLEDQHMGGAIMLVVGGIVYLAGGVWLMRDVLRDRRGPS